MLTTLRTLNWPTEQPPVVAAPSLLTLAEQPSTLVLTSHVAAINAATASIAAVIAQTADQPATTVTFQDMALVKTRSWPNV
jgi:hypothetical protein